MRILRQMLSWAAAAASALVVCTSAIGLLDVRTDPDRIASIAFCVASLALLTASLAAVRQPRRHAVLLLALATVVALSFTGVGRGTSGLTVTTPRNTYYVVGTMPLLCCVGLLILANQLAFWLARRNACACE